MDIGQLQALAAAVDTGTFDAAARALHVTPSAISQRIRALENSVGGVLLTRGKPVTPTAAGTPLLRLARQIDALTTDARAEATGAETTPTIPLAINGDSLATWALPALASLAHDLVFDIHREDQDHSWDLLRDGTVMAALTTEARPVQGCTSTRLGVMRYRPMATPAFVERWFADGISARTLGVAPVVVFDRKDEIQDRFLRHFGDGLTPPRHYVPASTEFAAAVRLSMGWAMLPDQQSLEEEVRGELVELDARHEYVELYWQQWALHTRGLERVASAIADAARGLAQS
ncbi:LysR family transcriptional regulator (chromosome initiation inhibitor) [Microbacteriaceae bacterium SG_E_30_P1]|uniref:LysR family transcriptional regulator (Chromosome initiation inhibitor) n=1 Tax=Antiquaquibacter oligotrophicus TaxID=2880260 RepID=A0ABT6KN41_9MICO|nr:LysR family transcriptional regulator ArgP [Antiquaquibacter oligotrophicus]MDH6181423.1 LysR family transcriptional regulator (chromosome initiation inhibitor) [Antiquaquibacter oligotrophicus]UDF12885.1 LysR family transcriptional regulator ArgP [Antiquaquibacter oligotrophicus]